MNLGSDRRRMTMICCDENDIYTYLQMRMNEYKAAESIAETSELNARQTGIGEMAKLASFILKQPIGVCFECGEIMFGVK